MDAGLQRKNMVDSQVRPSDITDRRIIHAMLDVAREAFVPDASKTVAYADRSLALTARRSMLAPRVFAKLVQLAAVQETDAVLDVGGGLGYSAAVLARLSRSVVMIESDADLAERARAALAGSGTFNVSVEAGPLQAGFKSGAPYDVIVVEGLIASVPSELTDQLAEGGRMVGVMVRGRVASAILARRAGGKVNTSLAFEAWAEPLDGFEVRYEFSL